MNLRGNQTVDWRRWCVTAGLWGPIVLSLSGSYAYLAILHKNWNLFPVVVHENGKYTLTATIFYFRHFVREILPTLFIAAAAVAAFHLNSPPFAAAVPQRRKLRRAALCFGLGWILFLAVTMGTAIHQQGWRETLVDALQFRTRDDRAEYGTHWQYHCLHLLDTVLFSLAVAWLARGVSGQGGPGFKLGGAGLLAAWFVAFAVLTLVFVPSLRAFTDPLCLAHQFREIATHRVLTVPVVFGLLYALERQVLGAAPWQPIQTKLLLQGLAMLAMATGIPLWICWQLSRVNILSLAQKQTSLAELYTSHNFEHCLDVVFALLLAGWLYLRVILRETKPAPEATPAGTSNER